MSKKYYQGETMGQTVDATDIDGILVDPDMIVITIVDPEGITKVDEQDMAKEGTGKYRYDYLIAVDAALGKWTTEIKAVKGYTQIEQDVFTVMEAL